MAPATFLLGGDIEIHRLGGTTTLPHLDENAAAARLSLSAEDIAALSAMKTE